MRLPTPASKDRSPGPRIRRGVRQDAGSVDYAQDRLWGTRFGDGGQMWATRPKPSPCDLISTLPISRLT